MSCLEKKKKHSVLLKAAVNLQKKVVLRSFLA